MSRQKARTLALARADDNWPAAKVELRPIEKLTPYARNARTHTDAQIAQIAASIKEWGWTNPCLVDESDGIIAGHGRVLAARALGITAVPVLVARGWSEAQKRAYVLADNQLALNAGWDMELLKVELGDLLGGGFDLALTGFGDDFIADLLAPAGTEGLTDPDEVPETPAEPVTRRGDVWLLGRHRLLCGDSTNPDDVNKSLNGASADTLTDPPYGIGYAYRSHNDADSEANAQLVRDVFALAPGAKIWTPGLMNLARDMPIFPKVKVLVWHKKFAQAGNGLGGASTWEPVLVHGVKGGRLPNDYLEFSTDRETGLRDKHPCPKPVALFAHLIEHLLGKGIFEPFSGSGTTLIAAEKLARSCFCIEMDPAYVDVAVTRWERFTGQAATLEGDGRTFAEVAPERMKPTKAHA